MLNTVNPIARLSGYFWHNPLALAFLMSASLLAGAYSFEYIGGYVPCNLCWPQRYAHMAILGLSGAGLLAKKYDLSLQNFLPWAVVIALDVSVVLAGYHAGVEQKWWQGPDTCTADALNPEADMGSLFDSMMETNLVLCDEIAWQMFGLSMAGYNVLISLLVGLFVTLAIIFRMRRDYAHTS